MNSFWILITIKFGIYRATIFAMPLNVFTIGLCLLSGIVIFSSYADCDPFALGEIKRVDSIVPYFVIKELAFLPGMMGLFTACVFSASLRLDKRNIKYLILIWFYWFVHRSIFYLFQYTLFGFELTGSSHVGRLSVQKQVYEKACPKISSKFNPFHW